MPPKHCILAFDTSAAHVAAALLCDGEIFADYFNEQAKGQAEDLIPVLDQLLGKADKSWSDLDGIGVGVGPGNFTGIRISVSAARGLALGLGIPAIGVSTFQALRFGFDGVVVTSVAAPRDQVYLDVSFGHDPILVNAQLDNIPVNVPARAEPLIIGARCDDIAACTSWQPTQPKYDLAHAIAHVADGRMNLKIKSERPKPLYIKPADAAPSTKPVPTIV